MLGRDFIKHILPEADFVQVRDSQPLLSGIPSKAALWSGSINVLAR